MDAMEERGRQAKVVIWAPSGEPAPRPDPVSPAPAG
jgi:hypothetical protein